MAHPSFHLFAGSATGAVVMLPMIIGKWKSKKPISGTLGLWISVSWAVGIYASIPNILSLTGLPEWLLSGWWMNMFLFHPLLDRLKNGGMLIGQAGITAIFVTQYCLTLWAIARVKEGPGSD